MSSSWTGATGVWTNGALWSAGVPGAGETAYFASGKIYSVTYNTTDTIAGLSGADSGGTFSLTGGTLTTNAFGWSGAFTQSAGTLDVLVAGAAFSSAITQSGGLLSFADGAQLFAGITQTGGVLNIAAGDLMLEGPFPEPASTLGGTVDGLGTLMLPTNDAVTIGAGAALNVQHLSVATAATLAFAGAAQYFGDITAANQATIESASTLALGSGTFGGQFAGGGALVLEGYDNLSGLALGGAGTSATIDNQAILASSITLGLSGTDNTELVVAAGGLLAFVQNGNEIYGGTLSTMAVLGTLAVGAPNASGADTIQVASLAVSGLLYINGTLDLAGTAATPHGFATLTGTVFGAGTLETSTDETLSLAPLAAGAMLDVAALEVASSSEILLTGSQVFGGTLVSTNGSMGIIDTNGAAFTLAGGGTLGVATLSGGGVVDVTGDLFVTSPTLTGTEALLVAGTLAGDNGIIALGNSAASSTVLSIAAAGTLALASLEGVTGTGTASVINAGLLTVTDVTPQGTAALTGVTLTNAGTLDVAAGVLELLTGKASLGGLVTGAGTLDLNGETVTVQPATTLSVTNVYWSASTLNLTADLNVAGTLASNGGNVLNTAGHVFTVSAGAFDATVAGGGTAVVAGVVDTGNTGFGLTLTGAGTTLLDEGDFTQDQGSVNFGSSTASTFSITSAATFSITDLFGINSTGTANVINNAGLFADDSALPLADSTNNIFISTFTNTGIIADQNGSLDLIGSLVNDGAVTIGQMLNVAGNVSADVNATGVWQIETGGTLNFDDFVTAQTSLNALGSVVGAGQTISFSGADGVLQIGKPVSFSGTVANFAAGDIIDVNAQVNAITLGNNNMLTLESVATISGVPTATVLGTIAMSGMGAGTLEIFKNNGGGEDIALLATATPQAPFGSSPLYNTATWIGPSGSFTNAADWATDYSLAGALTEPQITAAVPNPDMTIVLPSISSTSYPLLFDTNYDAFSLTGSAGSTLDITGGDFAANYGITDLGLVSLSAGTLEEVSGFGVYGGQIAQLTQAAGAVLQSDDGALGIGATNGLLGTVNEVIAGTLTGNGEIVLEAATFSIASSADLAVSTLGLTVANVVLTGNNLSFTGADFALNLGAPLNLSDGSTLNIDGGTFDVVAGSTLALGKGATIENGTLIAAGRAALAGRLNGVGNTELLLTGDAQGGDSAFYVGAAAAGGGADLLMIAAGAALYNPQFGGGYGGTVVNDGTIDQNAVTAPGPFQVIQNFTNAAGATLEVAAGDLDFYGNNAQGGTIALGGTVVGTGTLELDYDTTTLAANVDLAIDYLSLSTGTLALSADASYRNDFVDSGATIETDGHIFSLGNAPSLPGTTASAPASGSLQGVLTGTGELVVGGDYVLAGLTLTGQNIELADVGTILVGGGGFTLGTVTGDAPTISVASGAIFDFVGGGVDTGVAGSSFINAGLLELGETGLAGFKAGTLINSGTIDVTAGTLRVEATQANLAGTIDGPGVLSLQSDGTINFAGATLSAGEIVLASGNFALASNEAFGGIFVDQSSVLNLASFGLDLTGAGTLAGSITGTGSIVVGGTMSLGALELWSPATIDVTGTLYDDTTGSVYAGSTNASGPGAEISVAIGGNFDITQDGFIGASPPFSNFTLVNAGIFEKTGSTGISTISAATVFNTGTIDAADGTLDFTGTLVNDGTIFEDAFGGINAAGGITGTGIIIIDPATTTINGPVSSGQSVSFAGPDGTLALGDVTQFAGTITGFQTGDIVDLTNIAPSAITGESFGNNGVLTLFDAAGNIALTFASPSNFAIPLTFGTDGGAGSEIDSAVVPCFADGTMILTVAGERPVADIVVGDRLVTRGGARPVVWTGRRRIDVARHAAPAAVRPIRICAGAFAPGVPERDLRVSPLHAVFYGGELFEAADLINGVTIFQEQGTRFVTYFHVELDAHDVIFAEGLMVESFLDTGTKDMFEGAERLVLHPDFRTAADARFCVPMVRAGASLVALRGMLNRRAVAAGGRGVRTRYTIPHFD